MATPLPLEVSDSVTERPHQPSGLNFPKRSFGTRGVLRSFQPAWFSKWPFIHYDEAKDAAFCHTCMMATKNRRMKSNYADPAFVSKLNSLPVSYLMRCIDTQGQIQEGSGA